MKFVLLWYLDLNLIVVYFNFLRGNCVWSKRMLDLLEIVSKGRKFIIGFRVRYFVIKDVIMRVCLDREIL